MEQDEEVVAISDVVFRWKTATPVVLDIPSFVVHRGERLFVKGASGSGKSTLLGLLGGVLVPQQGTVRILGQALGGLGSAARDRFRADHLGFVFQIFNLLPYLSPIENVLLPCRFSPLRRSRAEQGGQGLESEARRLLAHLGLQDETLLVRKSTDLSVGQQQRVAVARALIGAPELLIADEPTSALDWDRRLDFLELLERECRNQKTTLVFVSHDASLESLFDRSVAMTEINRAVVVNGSWGGVS
ncbi:MAG: ATP-binding cassette domain-containing protein [Magnetococcales bacterium]|nr:ATP-binding cassette domain-containing protein [Magnetococcales bacterium]